MTKRRLPDSERGKQLRAELAIVAWFAGDYGAAIREIEAEVREVNHLTSRSGDYQMGFRNGFRAGRNFQSNSYPPLPEPSDDPA